MIAAALVNEEDIAHVTADVRGALSAREHRFHWRFEREPARFRMIDAICSGPVRCTLVRYQHDRKRWSERGRTQAFKCLLWHACTSGLQRLVIETRGRAADAADRRAISHMQKSAHADPGLTYSFESRLEPLLWIADALAGASTAAWGDGDTRYLERLDAIEPTILDADP